VSRRCGRARHVNCGWCGDVVCCATEDCGREGCAVCRVGRQPQQTHRSASLSDPMRDDAKADLAEKKTAQPMTVVEGRAVVPPKKKNRAGPHR
jgi:hypothetical protein